MLLCKGDSAPRSSDQFRLHTMQPQVVVASELAAQGLDMIFYTEMLMAAWGSTSSLNFNPMITICS